MIATFGISITYFGASIQGFESNAVLQILVVTLTIKTEASDDIPLNYPYRTLIAAYFPSIAPLESMGDLRIQGVKSYAWGHGWRSLANPCLPFLPMLYLVQCDYAKRIGQGHTSPSGGINARVRPPLSSPSASSLLLSTSRRLNDASTYSSLAPCYL